MAMSDYRLCDLCGGKVFYDVNLNYEWSDKNGNDSFKQKIESHQLVRDSNYKLDYLGDWAVICIDCAKKYKCVILPIEDMYLGR